MADTNLSPSGEPVVTTPPTQDELVDDLADLLEPPDEPDQPEAGHEDEAAKPEDDPLGLDAEDVEEPDAAEEPDGPDGEIKGGRFAPDSAKVNLEDGTTTTIADLKRGSMFQRDYTRKTQELSKDREAVKAEREQVSQQAQSLNQFSEYAAWYAETHMPKNPGPYQGPPDDFIGKQEWQMSVEAYRQHMAAWQAFKSQQQADSMRKDAETNRQKQERLNREAEALFKAMPILADPVKGPQARVALAEGLVKHYGFTAEELGEFTDHRMFLVARDALKAKRLEARAKEVPKQIATKPAKPGVRQAPQAAARKNAQVRAEQLRKNPTFENGVAALMDFDL